MSTSMRLFTLVLMTSSVLSAQEGSFGTRAVPSERQADASLTTQRCASCHSMNKVFKADHVGLEWGPVVVRMQEKEKSGLSDSDVARISEFLAWWSSPETPVSTKASPAKGAPPAAPALLSGSVATRETAVLAQGLIASDMPLPAAFELEDLTLHILSLTPMRSGDPHSELSALVRIGSREGRMSFRRNEDGSPRQEGFEIRNWRLGGRGYRQVVVLSPAPESETGEIELTLLVVSDALESKNKSRLRETLSKVAKKARKGKDRDDKDDDDDHEHRESGSSGKTDKKPRKDDSCPINH